MRHYWKTFLDSNPLTFKEIKRSLAYGVCNFLWRKFPKWYGFQTPLIKHIFLSRQKSSASLGSSSTGKAGKYPFFTKISSLGGGREIPPAYWGYFFGAPEILAIFKMGAVPIWPENTPGSPPNTSFHHFRFRRFRVMIGRWYFCGHILSGDGGHFFALHLRCILPKIDQQDRYIQTKTS